jgi:hypothetical protein
MNFTKTLWASAVATALATCSLTAHADAKRDLVQRLPLAQKAELEGLATSLIQSPARQLVGQLVQPAMSLVPEDKREQTGKQVDAEIQKFLDTSTPAIKNSAAKVGPAAIGSVLEDKLTEDELKQLVTMLESPIIKKYQAALPEIQKTLVEKISADARPQVEPKLQALQDSVRKILDTASNGRLSQAMAAQQQQQGAIPAPTPAAKPAAKPAPKK